MKNKTKHSLSLILSEKWYLMEKKKLVELGIQITKQILSCRTVIIFVIQEKCLFVFSILKNIKNGYTRLRFNKINDFTTS